MYQESGVGGEPYTRKNPTIEQKSNVVRVEILNFPVGGKGLLGVHYSAIRIISTYRTEFSCKQTDTVIIEYCADSRALFTENKNSYNEFRSKHDAGAIDLRDELNLYEVLEEAKVWEKTKYHFYESNCHVFALNMFNFCLKNTSRRKMQPKDIPNQSKYWIFSKLYIPITPFGAEISNATGHSREKGTRKKQLKVRSYLLKVKRSISVAAEP